MLIVKIELCPDDKTRAKELGQMVIYNDCTGNHEIGNYIYTLEDHSGILKSGRVEGHKRSLNPYYLLLKCLENTLNGYK